MSRYCECCGRALKACICGWISKVDSPTEVVILQHPSEVNQAKGTAKIVELCLATSRVLIGEDFTQHNELNRLLCRPNVLHLLLFPSDESHQLVTMVNDAMNASSPTTCLIVLDGTWKKAFKMFQVSKNLHLIPKVHLPLELSGRYTIRKSPRDNALSTVEAVYHALSILDSTAPQPLLDAFDKMIEFQLSQVPEHFRQSHFGTRNR
ncbi:tRNA-uridine aminocarboxypropyltransferase [Vibrio gallicus]|uniref:tRNA-uridine aminocarboxypropyltransferase n=1 Tax=Vibrio gallicus TaxID=190897 RepID=UPI0021C2C1E8|nr:tRNA-uridine aminocarboxypropyltransferase [Vibrio gallicus]